MFYKLFNKKTKFIREFTTRILSLDLEHGWIEDVNTPVPLTFIKEENGKGALQISILTFEDQRKPIADELLKSHEKIQNFKEYKVREWDVYEFDEETEEFYRKNFYFAKTHVVAYISYYGSLQSKGSKELKEAIKIVTSISVTSKN